MLDIRKELIAMLKQNTGLPVYFIQPPVNVATTMPLIVLEEVNNHDHFYSYNDETDYEIEIANVTYEVSVYGLEFEDIVVFSGVIDKAMKRHGFRKSWTSPDNYIEPLYCKTMRYTCKVQLNKDTNEYYIYK